ncbi:MAG: hypothetical protein ABWY78_23835, partial [Microvirga sp.]
MRIGAALSASRPGTDAQKSALDGSKAVPAMLLVASGTTALVFQVLWIKQLTLIVGVEVHAVAIGVGAFFAG